MRPAAVLSLLTAAGPAPAGPAGSNGRRLSVGPGHLLVLTDPDLDRIVLYDVRGDRPRKLVAFGERGLKPGQLQSPHGAAITARGDLLVADTFNHRIQSFDLTGALAGWPGRLLRTWSGRGDGPGQLDTPQSGLAVSPLEDEQRRVFVPDTRNHRVVVFDVDGPPLGLVLGGRGREPGRLDTPVGLAFDPQGRRVYVAEAGNRRVSAFAADTGAFLFAFGSETLRQPAGIAADSTGDLLVTDRVTRKVHRFRPEPAGAPQRARLASSWGRSGAGPGEWSGPQSIAVDARDRVYVADLAGGRCQMFTGDGAYLGAFGEDMTLGYPPDAPPSHGDVGTPTRQTCSNGGRYHLSVSAPDPYPLNQLFGLEATVEEGCDPPRRPVSARLRVDAAMPEHRHGMNTEAVVTPRGGGRFGVEGLLLHMPGRWEIRFDVTDGLVTERAQLDFILE
jgi:sugar lactone lactonase YvrE